MADLLVVDDDVEVGDLVAELFRDEGHRVRVARNGREGLNMLRVRRPDLVLLDVEMPQLTGPEMAHEMFLQNCGLEKIPVVLLSGVLNLQEVAAAVGTPYFLGKPYPLESLLAVAGHALIERASPRPRFSPVGG